MLRAVAEAARVLNREDLLGLAERNADFLMSSLSKAGRLYRSYKDGRAVLPGFLEDQAAVADGLLSLYEASFDPRWLEAVRALVDTMLSSFWDEKAGAFFDTAADQQALITRPQDMTDNAIPSGNSLAVDVLLRAGRLLGNQRWSDIGRQSLERVAPTAAKAPLAFGRMLAALDFELGHPVELAIIGRPDDPSTDALLEVARSRYLPNRLLASRADANGIEIPLLEGRQTIAGRATAYLCEGFVCQTPTTDPAELANQIDRATVPA